MKRGGNMRAVAELKRMTKKYGEPHVYDNEGDIPFDGEAFFSPCTLCKKQWRYHVTWWQHDEKFPTLMNAWLCEKHFELVGGVT